MVALGSAARIQPQQAFADGEAVSASRMVHTTGPGFFLERRPAMADFTTAFQWAMRFEDPEMACTQVPDVAPAGCAPPCYAISGINSGAWPEQFSSIAALPQSARTAAVEAFYKAEFWNRWFDQLASDDLAKRVFDFSVNGGSATAVKTLQQAVNTLGGNLTADGGWGPMTLAAANSANRAALVAAFIATRVAHYQAIAAANPSEAAYLKGWLSRAQR
jgi:Predicted Peptidoglycan domain